MTIVKVAGEKYHVNSDLYLKWEKIKDGGLQKMDDDKVFVVDGRERSGKSVFTMQQAAAIDPTLFEEALATGRVDRICFTGEETLRAIRTTKSTATQTKVIIFDEAFRGLASSSVLSKTNRIIVQALMEMGQNNLVLFIVLPSFFLLDRYPAVLRSNALFHVEKMKSNPKRRKFYVYNFHKKAYLYHLGIKKGWGYPISTRKNGTFFNKYPGGKEFEKLYREKKQQAFQEIEGKLTGEAEENIVRQQRNFAFNMWKQASQLKFTEMSRAIEDSGLKLSNHAVSQAVKMDEKRRRTPKNA